MRDVKNLRGQNVNLVIVDQGIDANLIQTHLGGVYGTGWSVGSRPPGSTPSSHGMMMARNIVKIAPDVTLFDLPLLPERIGDVGTFASLANAA
jgi:hypothetical protein